MAREGFQFDASTVADMELGYIGGLLKLDVQVDEQARVEAMANLANRRRASPLRKG